MKEMKGVELDLGRDVNCKGFLLLGLEPRGKSRFRTRILFMGCEVWIRLRLISGKMLIGSL